jgi:hypothetical protein
MSQSRIQIAATAVATAQRLAQMDPQAEAVGRTVDELESNIALLRSEVEKPAGEKNSFGDHSRKVDIENLGNQIDKLRSAAFVPASNYKRIVSILTGLKNACVAAQKPQNAALRPQIATIVEKVAGVFAEVDTVQDLDKPLEAIEKAVHGLYGDQSKNSTYYFDRRGKGHHEKTDAAKKAS